MVFESDATNLVAGDNNNVSDVFMHDRVAGLYDADQALQRQRAAGVVQRHDGGQRRLAASWPSGRTPPTSPTATRTSSTTCSCATPGCSSASGLASRPGAPSCRGRPRDALSVSANGRLVAFTTDAATVVTGDTNGGADVFARDRIAATTVRVSVATGGVEGGGGSSDPAVSGHGRVVAFESLASGLAPGDTNQRPDICRATT